MIICDPFVLVDFKIIQALFLGTAFPDMAFGNIIIGKTIIPPPPRRPFFVVG